MARAIWTGTLSFGLVNVPVSLYAATEDRAIRFNQFQAGTSDRVRNKRVNERTGEEVPFDQLVKGYDLGGGEYVLVEPDELAAVAPGRSRTIEVTDFVDQHEVDPVFFDRPYYLGPQRKEGARAYALLCRAMADMGKVAVGTFVLRDRQHLVTVRPGPGVLVLDTLRYADEVRDPTDLVEGVEGLEFDQRELDMAHLLVDSMSRPWEPARYRDDYRDRVEELVEQKRQGAVVVAERPEEAPAPVVDLLAALRESVRAARGTAADGEEPAAASRPSSRRAAKPSAKGASARRGAADADDEDRGADEPRPRRSRSRPSAGEGSGARGAPAGRRPAVGKAPKAPPARKRATGAGARKTAAPSQKRAGREAAPTTSAKPDRARRKAS